MSCEKQMLAQDYRIRYQPGGCDAVRVTEPKRCGPLNTTTGGYPLFPAARQRSRLRKHVCSKCNLFPAEVITAALEDVRTVQDEYPGDEEMMKKRLSKILVDDNKRREDEVDMYLGNLQEQDAYDRSMVLARSFRSPPPLPAGYFQGAAPRAGRKRRVPKRSSTKRSAKRRSKTR